MKNFFFLFLPEPEHDHETDPASKSTPSWLIFLGKFHVLIIHFPIALLPLSALLEFLAILSKKPMLRQAARVQFVLGAFAAIVAATLGWILAINTHPEQALQQTLFLHRWGGVSVAVLSGLGLLFLFTSKRFPKITPKLYKGVLVLLLVLVPVTAHFGGTLVYGLNYFTP